MTDEFQALAAEVARFQAWADSTVPLADRYNDWEINYDYWQRLYEVTTNFVKAVPFPQWDTAAIQLLLFTITRDNESKWLIREIAKIPDQLLFLAENAILSDERDAKYQIAAALGQLDTQSAEAESLLLQFVHDKDEYVRRRALMALADAGSTHVEALVESAWNTADEVQEYQRMAVLYALNTVNSPQLDHYLILAEADGRKYLVAMAARIHASRNAE